MSTVQQFTSVSDFWKGMVEPDFQESNAAPDDLRKAFHTAISLNHMADWVFTHHKKSIVNSLNYTDKIGNTKSVNIFSTFLTSLEQMEPNFALIRGIANASKHLKLNQKRPHLDAPTHAANTTVQTVGYGQGTFGTGPFGGTPQVMLEGASGFTPFNDIAKKVHDMWEQLRKKHSW